MEFLQLNKKGTNQKTETIYVSGISFQIYKQKGA